MRPTKPDDAPRRQNSQCARRAPRPAAVAGPAPASAVGTRRPFPSPPRRRVTCNAESGQSNSRFGRCNKQTSTLQPGSTVRPGRPEGSHQRERREADPPSAHHLATRGIRRNRICRVTRKLLRIAKPPKGSRLSICLGRMNFAASHRTWAHRHARGRRLASPDPPSAPPRQIPVEHRRIAFGKHFGDLQVPDAVEVKSADAFAGLSITRPVLRQLLTMKS